MSAKKERKSSVSVEVHDYSIKNKHGEWLEVTCHHEGDGYVTLKFETQESFNVSEPEELDDIVNTIKANWPKGGP